MDDRARALALHRARLLALPPAERVDAILAAQRPGKMLRLLPAQELFLTLVEAGLDRALPLLGLATTHQVEFLFDISSWERDRFEAAPAGHWLGVLHESDPEVVVRWLQEADEDLVVTTLLRLLHVYKLDESTDRDFWPPDRPLSTLDGLYYIEPRDDTPEAAGIALWEGLTRLRSRHRPAYEALLEQVLGPRHPSSKNARTSAAAAASPKRAFPSWTRPWRSGPRSRRPRAGCARRSMRASRRTPQP